MNDEENVNIKLGYLIKKLRKKKGISGAELAKTKCKSTTSIKI